MKILIGTGNKDKFAEIADILSELKMELLFAGDNPDLPDVIEDKETIRDNAIKKACELAGISGIYTLSDDTGLFVDALGGEPGVYSARFAGENCSYRDNREKLLHLLEGITERSASFRTVVALADTAGELLATTEGCVPGKITEQEIGVQGFGYDSIFFCSETGKTFGEMDADEKHLISHRGKAFRKMIAIIRELIEKEEMEAK
jgi:XTP/dITP diphosphohydrolase